MDGMRYDTWDAVIRPLLTEHFQVVSGLDRAYFSLLPSKTDIARRGLLAAAIGKDWKNYYGLSDQGREGPGGPSTRRSRSTSSMPRSGS